MALPSTLQVSMTPEELEFIAGEELIEIRPLVRMERIRFISGIYGPFVGGRIAKIPLWMAVNLKLKKKANIVAPEWLTVEFLQDRLADEIDGSQFSKLPFRYAEIAKVLLDVASDDLEDPDKIRSLLKDLREARQAKSRQGLQLLNHNILSLQNLCAMEINEIRPFFVKAMQTLVQLHLDEPSEYRSADDLRA